MNSKEVNQRQLELNNKERRRELIEINHQLRQPVNGILLLSPNQIYEVWKTTDKESFTFMLLSKHLNKKTQKIIRYGSSQPLTVGFKVGNDVIKYYVIQSIVIKEKTSLITVTCPTTEKKLLMGRFNKYKLP